ncbi:MAG: hypothetical protein F7C35_05150, partial [Desulfurococcales archaeon]|nr:hypothetical protein [Desulfurococcales archaeon]
MRRYTLVAIILVSLITLSPLLSTQGHAIIRHPAEFSAEPVVKGYKFYSPLEARLYARIMQGIALLIAYANVTDVAVSRASCLALSPSIPLLAPYPPGWESILSLPPSSLIKYRATIVGWNRDIPNSTFIVEPVASPSQAWSILAPLLPVPVGSNASLIMRASPNQTLINLSKSLGRMAASHSIETVSNQTAILARNLTSAIGPELLSVKVHWALSTLDGLLDNREAQYVSPCGTAAIMTGGYPTASPDKVINIAERTSRTSQFAVFLAELVLQSAVAVEEVTIQTPQGNMTIRNLTVMVSPVIGGLGGDREGALEKVGIASNMLANFVSSMGTVITKPPKLGAAQPANVTKLLEDVESGNESTALQAIMEAQSLLEQGLISQEDLNKLVEAFKEKYGYDPLNT